MFKEIINKIIWIIDEEGKIYSKDNEISLRHAEALASLSKELGYNFSEFNNICDSAKKIIKNNNIVFYNFFKDATTQKYNGVLFLPKKLTDNQKEVFKNIEFGIKNSFENLTIGKNNEDNKLFEINNGREENPIDILYDEIINEKKKLI